MLRCSDIINDLQWHIKAIITEFILFCDRFFVLLTNDRVFIIFIYPKYTNRH